MNDDRYKSTEDLPKTLPIFPLPGALLLPGGELPLNIFEPRYLQMIAHALSGDRLIGMIQPRHMESEHDLASTDSVSELYDIGCAGRITSFVEGDQNQVQIILSGICRFKIGRELDAINSFRLVRPLWDEFCVDLTDEDATVAEDREELLDSLRRFLASKSMQADWDEICEASTPTLINTMTLIGSFTSGEKQALLEAPDLLQRTRTLMALTEMSISSAANGDAVVLQ
jgi:Lon protease-like protein